MAEEVDRRMAMELVQRAITRSLEELAKETSETTILWPSSEEFTVESGQRAIERTVQEWELSESWKHCIDYLGTTAGRELGEQQGEQQQQQKRATGTEDGDLHCYRVQWSEPTRRKPVPVSTASVYFFIHQQQRSQSPVKVFYVLEGQRLVHRPGRTRFQEVWLRNIIKHKLSVTATTPGWVLNRNTDPVTEPSPCDVLQC